MDETICASVYLGDPRLAAHAASATAVWLWIADGSRLLWANPAGCAALGAASPQALLARRFAIGDPDARAHRAACRRPSRGRRRAAVSPAWLCRRRLDVADLLLCAPRIRQARRGFSWSRPSRSVPSCRSPSGCASSALPEDDAVAAFSPNGDEAVRDSRGRAAPRRGGGARRDRRHGARDRRARDRGRPGHIEHRPGGAPADRPGDEHGAARPFLRSGRRRNRARSRLPPSNRPRSSRLRSSRPGRTARRTPSRSAQSSQPRPSRRRSGAAAPSPAVRLADGRGRPVLPRFGRIRCSARW